MARGKAGTVERAGDEATAIATLDEARQITAELRQAGDNLSALIFEAVTKRVWFALGYKSKSEWCANEFGWTSAHVMNLFYAEQLNRQLRERYEALPRRFELSDEQARAVRQLEWGVAGFMEAVDRVAKITPPEQAAYLHERVTELAQDYVRRWRDAAKVRKALRESTGRVSTPKAKDEPVDIGATPARELNPRTYRSYANSLVRQAKQLPKPAQVPAELRPQVAEALDAYVAQLQELLARIVAVRGARNGD